MSAGRARSFGPSSLLLTATRDTRKVCLWPRRSREPFTARLHLLMVVPEVHDLTGPKAAASLVLPGATRFKLAMESDAAQSYLDKRSAELIQKGINADFETSRGDPARVIIASARRISADLVIMGTHGRSGANAFWEESVAARVVARIQAPLLLVPTGRSDEHQKGAGAV